MSRLEALFASGAVAAACERLRPFSDSCFRMIAASAHLIERRGSGPAGLRIRVPRLLCPCGRHPYAGAACTLVPVRKAFLCRAAGTEYMLALVTPSKTADQLEAEKQAAALAAIRFIRSNMLLGLGTGSTAGYFLALLGETVRRRELKVAAVASSLHIAARAKDLGIPVSEPRRGLRPDLAVDSADEIAPDLSLIKGAGGALLREKVLARVSRHFLVIADSSKRVAQLGRRPVPLEVTPFATPWVMDEVEELGGKPVWRMDKSMPERPILTDQRNHLIDCDFGLIAEPQKLAMALDEIPGVVGHGLFLGLATAALIADGGEVLVLRPRQPAVPLGQCEQVLE